MSRWHIVLKPEGKNPGLIAKAKDHAANGEPENLGGMIVYVTDGSSKQEVSRVAFVRRNSKNPHNSFTSQLQAEVDKARQAARLLNETLVGAGELL